MNIELSDEKLNLKFERLKKYIKDLGSVAVAFSGGVDSTFLLKTAHDVLGDNAVAVIASINSFPQAELKEAEKFCMDEGLRFYICKIDELQIEGFADNPPDRCYICKTQILKNIKKIAADNNIEYVVEGSNIDDDGDYRPGQKAVKEQGVLSPLKVNGLSKSDIRTISKELNLKTWNKLSSACLSSRFAYGEKITKEKLRMVEKAEAFLKSLGFGQLRVRIHGLMARIEVMPEEFARISEADTAKRINEELKSYGFTYVSLDLGGYRMGSMNELLK